MKIIKILSLAAILFSFVNANAQTNVPAGYVKGSLVLANGSTVTGFVKENIRKSASVSFIESTGGKKKTYDGSQLSGVEINGMKYTCVGGDFFKKICENKMALLQKASDASGKLVYNGSDAVVSSGTEGKPGDYFTLDGAKKLTLVSAASINEVVSANFPSCKPEIEKAVAAGGNVNSINGNK